MFQPNAKTITTMLDKLPFEAFEFICEEYPYLLEITPDKVEYITWEDTAEGAYYGTPDEVAQDYGYANLEDWYEDDRAPMITVFDSGLLIIE